MEGTTDQFCTNYRKIGNMNSTESENPTIGISARQIRILSSNIQNAKGALVAIDADSNVLNQLEELTNTKEATIALVGGYKKLIDKNLISDLKSLSGHKDIQKRYLQPFITWQILDKDHPYDLLLSEKEANEIEQNAIITTQDIEGNIDFKDQPKGWPFFKWIAILWSLFCLLGAGFGMLGAVLEYIDYMGNENSINKLAFELGSGIAMSLWFFSWFAIAGSSALIYYLSKEKN
jgi:hypothetical protein